MSSIDPDEIARFSRHAQEWWDPKGVWSPLHKLNPARLDYIRETVCEHFKRKPEGKPFKGLSVLDIGCGGGLMSEPLARLGAKVTGIDASSEAIAAAKAHAKEQGLNITYMCGSVETLALSSPKAFDIVTALEIVEHAADIGSLLRSAQALLKPEGILILSTVNRTMKSYLLGIVAAEYILRWVPPGTHDWRKFLRPSELVAHLEKAGLSAIDITGIKYDPLRDAFHLRQGAVGVNYLVTGVKPHTFL
ncbi:MAG: bifunctional 2-polyprenyl-6-hydroxyphenol methylase/3-demethylubiquinol 3-O-methyltransferase UbiG [Alphaproteobacteria bacterium]|nr:bifunctional 2-polyprenyl-6-hydroxyphenol methylase/3-demethylubiquinol 3-O-methyltransferase UbiG [Alphaproteobacteria bacterium]